MVISARGCVLGALVLSVACGAGATDASSTTPAAPTTAKADPSAPCPPVADERNDRPALISADTESACERSHGNQVPSLTQGAFLTKTWTTLALEATHEETARCARAEMDRRMKKRCADYGLGACCPHPPALPTGKP